MRYILLFVYLALMVFFMVFNAGCASSKKLNHDPNIPAVAVGYPSVEFQACGNLYNGLGTCYLRKDQNLSLVNLKIQGYYKGTGRVYSAECEVDESFTYTNHELVKVKLPDQLVKSSCIFNIILSPEYPKASESELEVYPLVGALVLRSAWADHIWRGEVRKVTGNWRSVLGLPLWSPENKAIVAVYGCGIDYEQSLQVFDGLLEVPLEQAVLKTNKGLCIAEGMAVTGALWNYVFTVPIAQYATSLPDVLRWEGMGFTPLSVPSIKVSGSNLSVASEESVSVIGLNTEFVLGNKALFMNFKTGEKNTIRFVTVKGRTIIGEWEPLFQRFKWIQ